MANPKQEEKIVVLYYIGTEYEKNNQHPKFEIKKRLYPDADPRTGVVADLKLGDAIRVPEGDVPDLLRKSTVYISGKGQFMAFTEREDIAAAVVQQWNSGNKDVSVPNNPTLADFLRIAPSAEVKHELVQSLTLEDLKAMLEAKQAAEGVGKVSEDVGADVKAATKQTKEKEVK